MDAVNRVIVYYELNLSKDIYYKIEYLNEVRNSLTPHECELEKKRLKI